MAKWNLVAMGETGLTGWTAKAATPIAVSIARRTGRPEPEIRALIGAVFLAISLIDFLRTVDAVITAGRSIAEPANGGASRRQQQPSGTTARVGSVSRPKRRALPRG